MFGVRIGAAAAVLKARRAPLDDRPRVRSAK